MRLLLGLFIGFAFGALYGVQYAVQIPDSKFVKGIGLAKLLWKVWNS
ncbi:hypothetical protein [Tumebacillus flagellatus]|nr:hypothetical protein [Tumebacillus flagellatus]